MDIAAPHRASDFYCRDHPKLPQNRVLGVAYGPGPLSMGQPKSRIAISVGGYL